MYPSRGGGYGQQQYGSQSSYGQNLGSSFQGSSASGAEGGSHVSLSSRHQSITGAPHETEIGGYRSHLSTPSQYGTQYGSVYGSSSRSSSQPLSTKGVGSSVLEHSSGYVPTLPDSSKLASESYLTPSSHGYGQKREELYSDKVSGYPPADRKQYGERSGAYTGRELQNEPTNRYTDSSNFGRQAGLYDRIDQASLLRGEQLLKIQSLHSSSVDGGVRQADYLTERGSTVRHSDKAAMHYGGRPETDPHGLSVHNTSSYASQYTPSLLGAVPQRNLDNYTFPKSSSNPGYGVTLPHKSSSNPGYGVSLPPGRNYGTRKAIQNTASLNLDYPGSMLAPGGGGGGGDLRVDNLRKDDRASYLREFQLREEARRRDNMRAKDKEQERDRARGRERERGRQRERGREKARDRVREQIIERQKKERERAHEIKRDRTPTSRTTSKDPKERTPLPKVVSRDARSSSLRRDAPHREAFIRRSSPIKPIKRDYVCKVLSSRLIDTERDYFTLNKRYPRLFVPSEFSKVVVSWPNQKLTLSMHTAVSFEHDYMEDSGVDVKNASTKSLAWETGGKTIWNAKMILMSGLSRTALEDLSSDKLFEDRIPHICNILKFAVLKRDHSLMAIGGPWDPIDGVDPSVDQFSLIYTMLRHAKDKLHLDLSNCRNWNPFLEIHYNRVGTDGVSSYKEITVLFVPDLSECLPSFDAWSTQWLAHRKALTERDQLPSQETKKDGIDGKGSLDTVEVAKEAEENLPGDPSDAPNTGTKKTVKKIIKKVERHVNDGKATSKKDEKDVPEKVVISKTTAPKEESTGTSSNKKIVKKAVAKPTQNQEKSSEPIAKASEQNPSKKIVKKKIIKKVAKRKITEVDNTYDGYTKKKVVGAGTKTSDSEMKTIAESLKGKEENASKTVEIKHNDGSQDTEEKPKKGASSSSKKDIKTSGGKKSEMKNNSDIHSEGGKVDERNAKVIITEEDGKDESRIQVKDRKKYEEPPRPGFILQVKRSKYSKLRSLSLSLDSLLNYTDNDCDESSFEVSLFAESLFEMLQYQMGTRIFKFLKKLRVKFMRERNQRKKQLELQNEAKSQNNGQKIVEDNGKETSVITESASEKDDKESSRKETKEISDNEETVAEIEETLSGNETSCDEGSNMEVEDDDDVVDDDVDDDVDDVIDEDLEEDPEEDSEEDPEEDPEECEDMDDEQEESAEEEEEEEENHEKSNGTISEAEANKKEEKDSINEANKHEKQEGGGFSEVPKREETVDKELLQAFRFFDRNQAGYVRVEDMRITMHSLGKFLSHRQVKELVQCGLLESNTGRDDRILYNKLVRLSL